MAVTIFQRTKVINNITIINGKKDEQKPKKQMQQEINAKIRGRTYARRTVDRQN